MSESKVTVQPYSDKNIVVQGDFETHAKALKKYQARWNSRLKCGPGWLVPNEFESAVKAHFNIEDDDDTVETKYKPAPKKAPAKKVAPKAPEPEPEAEEEEPAEEDEPREPSPPPKPVKRAEPAKKVAPKKALPQKKEEPEDDVTSLANLMKDMMSRMDRLEQRK